MNSYYGLGISIDQELCKQFVSVTKHFGFFVLWHINLRRSYNAKTILVEEQQGSNLIYRREDKVSFLSQEYKSRSDPKSATGVGTHWIETAVQHFNYYDPVTSL